MMVGWLFTTELEHTMQSGGRKGVVIITLFAITLAFSQQTTQASHAVSTQAYPCLSTFTISWSKAAAVWWSVLHFLYCYPA
jgi:hypothetical protein